MRLTTSHTTLEVVDGRYPRYDVHCKAPITPTTPTTSLVVGQSFHCRSQRHDVFDRANPTYALLFQLIAFCVSSNASLMLPHILFLERRPKTKDQRPTKVTQERISFMFLPSFSLLFVFIIMKFLYSILNFAKFSSSLSYFLFRTCFPHSFGGAFFSSESSSPNALHCCSSSLSICLLQCKKLVSRSHGATAVVIVIVVVGNFRSPLTFLLHANTRHFFLFFCFAHFIIPFS